MSIYSKRVLAKCSDHLWTSTYTLKNRRLSHRFIVKHCSKLLWRSVVQNATPPCCDFTWLVTARLINLCPTLKHGNCDVHVRDDTRHRLLDRWRCPHIAMCIKTSLWPNRMDENNMQNLVLSLVNRLPRYENLCLGPTIEATPHNSYVQI